MPSQDAIFKWVPITEELPPLPPKICGGLRIWIYARDGEKWSLNFEAVYTYYGRFEFEGNDITEYVTHWCNIPKPPKEYAIARSNF